jgi:hypothetical protein
MQHACEQHCHTPLVVVRLSASAIPPLVSGRVRASAQCGRWNDRRLCAYLGHSVDQCQYPEADEVDGASPLGVETDADIAWRKDLLRKIGYKL